MAVRFSTLSRVAQQVANSNKEKLAELPVKSAALTASQKRYLESVIRVDQAGELGANYIYQGQIYALVSKHPHLKPVLQHMWEQEVHHHNTFNQLQTVHRVRPSLITPLWKIGAVGIGYVTGSISKEAAMACTVAVETVIGGHYNEQLRDLTNEFPESKEISELKATISKFRDEELEHLDTAVEHNADDAVPYWLITDVIKGICKVAITVAKQI